MFHDAWAERIAFEPARLTIETEPFSFSEDEIVPAARIVIDGIRTILKSDWVIPVFVVESENAEIFHLDGLADGVRLQIFWHVWKSPPPGSTMTFADYWFPGASLRTETREGGELRPQKGA